MVLLSALGGRADARAVAELDDADCARCHEVVAQQWEASQHRSSFSDRSFQTAFALEPRPFCRSCHAPQVASTDIEPTAVVGVGCVSCHVREGAVLATQTTAPAPHSVVRDPEFGTARACEGCHQFEFPDAELRDGIALMQSTIDEHADSPFADRGCAQCHMPLEGGVRSHRFGASRDPGMLSSALRVEAQRTAPESFTITLRAAKVGHAVPTGDLLRRLEVGVEIVGDEERSARRYLARHFGPRVQSSGVVLKAELRDDRVPADGGPRIVRLNLHGSRQREVRWWVAHQRVAHQRSRDERDAAIDGEVVLASGVFDEETAR